MTREELDKMRAELTQEIKTLAPNFDGEYLGLWVRYCATISFINGPRLSYTGPAYSGVLQPSTIDDLPIEGLLDLRDALRDT